MKILIKQTLLTILILLTFITFPITVKAQQPMLVSETEEVPQISLINVNPINNKLKAIIENVLPKVLESLIYNIKGQFSYEVKTALTITLNVSQDILIDKTELTKFYIYFRSTISLQLASLVEKQNVNDQDMVKVLKDSGKDTSNIETTINSRNSVNAVLKEQSNLIIQEVNKIDPNNYYSEQENLNNLFKKTQSLNDEFKYVVETSINIIKQLSALGNF